MSEYVYNIMSRQRCSYEGPLLRVLIMSKGVQLFSVTTVTDFGGSPAIVSLPISPFMLMYVLCFGTPDSKCRYGIQNDYKRLCFSDIQIVKDNTIVSSNYVFCCKRIHYGLVYETTNQCSPSVLSVHLIHGGVAVDNILGPTLEEEKRVWCGLQEHEACALISRISIVLQHHLYLFITVWPWKTNNRSRAKIWSVSRQECRKSKTQHHSGLVVYFVVVGKCHRMLTLGFRTIKRGDMDKFRASYTNYMNSNLERVTFSTP